MSKTMTILLLAICLITQTIQAADKEPLVKTAQNIALFAGGCFWCIEHDFAKVQGVLDVTSGYTGGTVESPDYEAVSAGGTGHYESIRVEFDPKLVSYSQLLEVFWHNIDPFDDGGQFCDKGLSYRAAVFYLDEDQKSQAEESKKNVEQKLGKLVVTEILPDGPFYKAEDYHQDYAKKNPIRYKYYRFSCGRDRRLQDVWK